MLEDDQKNDCFCILDFGGRALRSYIADLLRPSHRITSEQRTKNYEHCPKLQLHVEV